MKFSVHQTKLVAKKQKSIECRDGRADCAYTDMHLVRRFDAHPRDPPPPRPHAAAYCYSIAVTATCVVRLTPRDEDSCPDPLFLFDANQKWIGAGLSSYAHRRKLFAGQSNLLAIHHTSKHPLSRWSPTIATPGSKESEKAGQSAIERRNCDWPPWGWV